jgi:hypothetical protein
MALLTDKRIRRIAYFSAAVPQHFLVPTSLYRGRLDRLLQDFGENDRAGLSERVRYYCKLDEPFEPSDGAVTLKGVPSNRQTMYYYDLRAMMRCFPPKVRIDYQFGDVNWVMEHPSLVKSRPVSENNANNVLLKLNRVRHFFPLDDPFRYEDKRGLLVWRGAGGQQHRNDFLRKYWDHPVCDVGQVNEPSNDGMSDWVKPKMSVKEQLRYKFILSIEGNDVASNLKWISQSNSLCFMTRPKFETWFMEGRLVPGTHYVELRDDYADLPEKIDHYLANPDEAKAIIRNFQAYYRIFTDVRREELLCLLVMKQYLELAGQLASV